MAYTETVNGFTINRIGSPGDRTTGGTSVIRTTPSGFAETKVRVPDVEAYTKFAETKKAEASRLKTETEQDIARFRTAQEKQEADDLLKQRKAYIGKERVTNKIKGRITQERKSPRWKGFEQKKKQREYLTDFAVYERSKKEIAELNTDIEKINKELASYKPTKEVTVIGSSYYAYGEGSGSITPITVQSAEDFQKFVQASQIDYSESSTLTIKDIGTGEIVQQGYSAPLSPIAGTNFEARAEGLAQYPQLAALPGYVPTYSIQTTPTKIERARVEIGLTPEGQIDRNRLTGTSIDTQYLENQRILKNRERLRDDPIGELARLFPPAVESAFAKAPEFFFQEGQKGKQQVLTALTPARNFAVSLRPEGSSQSFGGDLLAEVPPLLTGIPKGLVELTNVVGFGLRTEFDIVSGTTRKAIKDPEGLWKDIEYGIGGITAYGAKESETFGSRFVTGIKERESPLIAFARAGQSTQTFKSGVGLATTVGAGFKEEFERSPSSFLGEIIGAELLIVGTESLLTGISKTRALKGTPAKFYEPGRGIVKGSIVDDFPSQATFKSGRKIPLGQQAGKDVLRQSDDFIRYGEKIYVTRVKAPTIKQPSTLFDYVLGRKPGQFKSQYFTTKQTVLLKYTPSQAASYDDLIRLGGKQQQIFQVSPTEFRDLTRGIIGESRFPVKLKPGASGTRKVIGGSERGMFFSAPQKGNIVAYLDDAGKQITRTFPEGTPQVYTYYAGTGLSYDDLLRGNFRLGRGGSPTIKGAKEYVTQYPADLLTRPISRSEIDDILRALKTSKSTQSKVASGKLTVEQLAYAKRLATFGDDAGRIVPGAASTAGVRGELEVTAGLESVFRRAGVKSRNIIDDVFRLSDTTVYDPATKNVFGVGFFERQFVSKAPKVTYTIDDFARIASGVKRTSRVSSAAVPILSYSRVASTFLAPLPLAFSSPSTKSEAPFSSPAPYSVPSSSQVSYGLPSPLPSTVSTPPSIVPIDYSFPPSSPPSIVSVPYELLPPSSPPPSIFSPPSPPTKRPLKVPPKQQDRLSFVSEKPDGTFNAFVRRNKNTKWVKVTKKPLPYNAAFNEGLEVADNTLGRSVRLKRASKSSNVFDDPFINNAKFRRRKGKSKIPGEETIFVEKSQFALDTLGEKQGLKTSKYRRGNPWGF